MFYDCSSITSLNLNSFDTSQVEYMNNMFYKCSFLDILYIQNFSRLSLINFYNMFKYVNNSIRIYTNNDFLIIINNSNSSLNY